ncbi:MAG: hypothetical protein AAF645_27680, partial [Myxococcota bacterium]
MKLRGSHTLAACALLGLVGASPNARAQEPAEAPSAETASAEAPSAEASAATDSVTLADYLNALARERLIAEESGSSDRLRALVRRGEDAYFEQDYDEAALLLYEVVESPRFTDFSDLEEFASAELLLAGALAELGSLRSASRYLQRTIERGQSDPYFGPA